MTRNEFSIFEKNALSRHF
uniref:CSON014417 protein n=1 Tax=Culicoides sonorensis TaxID=179676 RepID=A0A336JX68_CULSO